MYLISCKLISNFSFLTVTSWKTDRTLQTFYHKNKCFSTTLTQMRLEGNSHYLWREKIVAKWYCIMILAYGLFLKEWSSLASVVILIFGLLFVWVTRLVNLSRSQVDRPCYWSQPPWRTKSMTNTFENKYSFFKRIIYV